MMHEQVTDMDQVADAVGKKKWGADVEGHVEWFQAGASYSRLDGLAGSRWIMLVAMW